MKKAATVEVAPTQAGTPFAGGVYIARFFEGATARALIVAPRAEGEFIDLTHAAAMKKAKAAKIGGFKDWTLPTRLQGLLLWENRKALAKTDDAFAETIYWLLEQPESTSVYAWCQGFPWGYQNDFRKSDLIRARLVRRVAI